MRAPPLGRFVLILTVLGATAARLHAHTVDALAATQEVNRCLRLVKVAASRRQRRDGRWFRLVVQAFRPAVDHDVARERRDPRCPTSKPSGLPHGAGGPEGPHY